jgi:anti-sigma factor RsiW
MTIESQIDTSRTKGFCTNTEIGARLPDYVLDLVDDSEAEEIERHLTECIFCKENYLTVLRARGTAQMVEPDADEEPDGSSKPAPKEPESDTVPMLAKGIGSGI